MDQQRLDELKMDWLLDHDYHEDDSQPDDSVDDALIETLAYHLEEDRVSIDDPDFEFFFRAYLHNNDYSYSATEVHRAIEKFRRGGEKLVTRMDALKQVFAPLFKVPDSARIADLKAEHQVTPYEWEELRMEFE